MDLSTAVSTTVAALRRRPADLLPFYVLGAAVPAIARVVSFTGLVAVYFYLESTGRLATLRDGLAGLDGSMPDPEAEPTAFEQWSGEVGALLAEVLDPVSLALLGSTVLATVAVAVVLNAGATAGQYAACVGHLGDERAGTAGIAGIRGHWVAMLGLLLLEFFLAVGSLAVVAGLVAALAVASPIAAALVGLGAGFLWLGFALAVRAVFAFAPVLLVVDDAGVVGSLRAALGFLRANPLEAAGYYALAFGTVLAVSSTAGALTATGSPSGVGLITLLVVPPILHLVKVGLVGGWRGSVDPMSAPDRSPVDQFRAGVLDGLRELRAFVRATPGAHLLATGALVGGFAAGWAFAEPLVGVVDASIAARLEGHVPPVAAVEFFANNWTVALGTGFAGVALAVPSLVSLAFNGFLLAVLTRLETDPVALATFVAPHGVLEIPALVVSGAVGVWLGRAGWRTWRGGAARADLADAFERAFRVLVGVGVVLLVAGLIEGFVSPYYGVLLP
ncbi:hypothetical protein GCM10027435_09820 [Haloparvum alkalitolerans]|uniref:stage II sporulation protein M n=1 Tax=Haloparvum alkalitolerans TaxID=1042953 RepID=UPI003CE78F6E